MFAINTGAILAFWWLSSGFEITRTSSDAFNGLGRVTGLLGTYLVLWQLLFMARLPWLERAFGLERMAVLHKWNGYLVIALLVGHAIFQTLGYQLGDGKDVAAQLGDFITSYDGLLAAIVSLGLFIVVVVASITIAARHLAYETWYFIHLYAYLAVVLAFSHQLATGVDFAGNPAFVWYWCFLYGVVAASILLFRVIEPVATYRRHRFRVQAVEREARGVFSVYISGRDLDQFEAEAGQFAIWRFLDRTRWWQAHPFSISAIPDGRRLRITVKNIGDFTSGVHTSSRARRSSSMAHSASSQSGLLTERCCSSPAGSESPRSGRSPRRWPPTVSTCASFIALTARAISCSRRRWTPLPQTLACGSITW